MRKGFIKRVAGLAATAAFAFTMVFAVAAVDVQAEDKPITLTQGETTATYATVAEAVAAVQTGGAQATITLTQDFTGAGVKVQAGQNIVFDLGGHTWDITDTVGSAGTETNGLQLLQGSTVTIKNGKVTSSTAKLLVQNYCDLTIDGVTMKAADGSGNLTVSNNNGSTKITGGSVIDAPAGGSAFDSDKWGSYDGGNVTLENAVVNGNVQATNGGKIELQGGTINGNVFASNYGSDAFSKESATVTVSGTTINGNFTVQNNGAGTISGGMVTGTVSSEGTNTVSVTGGEIGTVGSQVTISGDYANITTASGATKTVVGTARVQAEVQALQSGDSVEIYVGEGTQLTVADGVKVSNKGNGNVVINGETVDANENVTVHTHQAQKVEAKQPTATEAGNIAYWYCAGCDKYFSDEALTKEIQKADTVIPATGKTEDGKGDDDKGEKQQTTEKEQISKVPKTGDTANISVYAAVMLAALAVLGVAEAGKKKM